MPRLTPEGLIRREYGSSRNFMTPQVLSIGWIVPGEIAYELSQGTGIHHEPIWGVSIVAKAVAAQIQAALQRQEETTHGS